MSAGVTPSRSCGHHPAYDTGRRYRATHSPKNRPDGESGEAVSVPVRRLPALADDVRVADPAADCLLAEQAYRRWGRPRSAESPHPARVTAESEVSATAAER
ncbi:hypothetical protein ACE1SV_75730 [Streptomyces sennicomposti]